MTTPTTAAGRAHVAHTVGMDVLDEVLAIEAEARAAALQDAKIAVLGVPWASCVGIRKRICDAIDALRERSDPITVKSIPGYGE